MPDDAKPDGAIPAQLSKAESGEIAPKKSFLGRISEYKEAIGVLVAIFGAVSSCVAWVISYFATQAAVSELECRLTHQINAANFDSKSEIIRSHIATKQSLIQSAALQRQTQGNQSIVVKLTNEVKELEKEAKEESRKSTEQLNLAAKCATAK